MRGSGPLALSTGQAARYCFVTSETILKWIRTGQLTAQRTPGGQYRIRVRDLRSFLKEHDMSTELLDEETGVQPYCWEFHCRQGSDEKGSVCQVCPVYRSGARSCWELHDLLPEDRRRMADCAHCEFLHRHGPSSDNGEPETRRGEG